MDLLPIELTINIYKLCHEMLYFTVMDQLKQYRINCVFSVSLNFLQRGYFVYKGVKIPSISLNNINAESNDILKLINSDRIRRIKKIHN